MPLEIAGVVIDQLLSIETSETARFVRHAVPGGSGDLAQDLGRPSVCIRVRGIAYGAEAAQRITALRGHLLTRAPVDFLCELTGEGYFSQVLVDHLLVVERAGYPDQFDYECAVSEYVPPPPPPAGSLFDAIDGDLLDEAMSLMDDIQNALDEVSGLLDLLSGAADFGDPTTRLPAMLSSFTDVAGGATGTLTTIGDLL